MKRLLSGAEAPAQRSYDFLLKFVIVGDTNVGKSCILLRFTDKRFRAQHDVTIGVEFGSRVVEAEGELFKCHVWDTAGQESFRSITRSYYRCAAAALLVFDVSRRATFEHLEQWAHDVLAAASLDTVLAIVGNKTDLEDREVSAEEGAALALRLNAQYYEVSAKSDIGVDAAFVGAALAAIRKHRARPADATRISPVQRLTLTPHQTTGCCT